MISSMISCGFSSSTSSSALAWSSARFFSAAVGSKVKLPRPGTFEGWAGAEVAEAALVLGAGDVVVLPVFAAFVDVLGAGEDVALGVEVEPVWPVSPAGVA